MEKYSPEIQNEISYILEKIKPWNNLFNINIDYFIDGWSIKLKEKCLYPRRIIIFKSYLNNFYSIKSFEVQLNKFKNEGYNELYTKEDIENNIDLIKELRNVIYGKDFINFTSKELKNKVLNKFQNSGL